MPAYWNDPPRAAQHSVDDRDVLGEALSALAWRPVVLADGVVVVPGDPGADPELETTSGEVVDRHCLVGELGRVVQQGVGDERADANPLGARGHVCQHGPAVEPVTVQVAVVAGVVGDVGGVEAHLLGLAPAFDELVQRRVLRDQDSKSNRLVVAHLVTLFGYGMRW